MTIVKAVIPAQAGIHHPPAQAVREDSRLRGNDDFNIDENGRIK
jgi:hypothetical protein